MKGVEPFSVGQRSDISIGFSKLPASNSRTANRPGIRTFASSPSRRCFFRPQVGREDVSLAGLDFEIAAICRQGGLDRQPRRVHSSRNQETGMFSGDKSIRRHRRPSEEPVSAIRPKRRFIRLPVKAVPLGRAPAVVAALETGVGDQVPGPPAGTALPGRRKGPRASSNSTSSSQRDPSK